MEIRFADRMADRAMIAVLSSGETIGSEVAREIETTYAHAIKIVSTLVEKGYMEKEPSGRSKILSLTDEGERIAQKLLEIRNIEEGLGR